MRIAVFGATGQLGQRVVAEAVRRGHQVTAAVRDAGRLAGRHDQLTVTVADVTDPQSVAQAVVDHDAVISVVGRDAEHPGFLAIAVGALLIGLSQAGVHRLVIGGGAGSLLVAPDTRLVDTPDFHDEWKPEALAQADALELLRGAETDVDWTYVSPGALLAPGERRGVYRTGGDDLLRDESGQSHISMEDFAIALVDEVEQPRYVRRRFTAAY